jgi:hypothetical protein
LKSTKVWYNRHRRSTWSIYSYIALPTAMNWSHSTCCKYSMLNALNLQDGRPISMNIYL